MVSTDTTTSNNKRIVDFEPHHHTIHHHFPSFCHRNRNRIDFLFQMRPDLQWRMHALIRRELECRFLARRACNQHGIRGWALHGLNSLHIRLDKDIPGGKRWKNDGLSWWWSREGLYERENMAGPLRTRHVTILSTSALRDYRVS